MKYFPLNVMTAKVKYFKLFIYEVKQRPIYVLNMLV